MMEKIFIGDKKGNITQWCRKNNVPLALAKDILRVIEMPNDMPFYIERIMDNFKKINKKAKDKLRNALVRVQIECNLTTRSDPIKVSQQYYVVEVLEKLLYGNNLLMREDLEIEEEIKGKKKKG